MSALGTPRAPGVYLPSMQAIVRYSNSAYLQYWELSVEPTLYASRVTFSVSRRPRLSLAAFLALIAIAAGASGCSSSDEGSRQAANLGTRICILNSWTEKVTVQYTAKDTSTREGNLSPGEQSCAEGSTLFSPRNDVDGILVLPEPARFFFMSSTNSSVHLWPGSRSLQKACRERQGRIRIPSAFT